MLDSLGNWKIIALETGDFRLDGGAMMGSVPKVLWEKTNPPDGFNRIDLALRCLLLDNGEYRILIESGMGDKIGPSFSNRYHVKQPKHPLKEKLNEYGYNIEDITHVILTHLHFDHSGGATTYDSHGKLVPAFTNATYYVSEKNWEAGTNPCPRDSASYLDINYLPLQNTDQLELEYKKLNICDYDNYNGQSILCFGFLHHLPDEVLQERINFIHNKMKPGQLLLVMEPRYDFVNFEMAFLIQALRMALPNHYPNKKDYKNFYHHAYNIYRELGELDHEQSTLDNESPSELIVDTIKKNYNDVEIKYTTAFYDKFIGSLRLSVDDNEKIAVILKKLDNIIVNYNNTILINRSCDKQIIIKRPNLFIFMLLDFPQLISI